jgi:hypothetical protein
LQLGAKFKSLNLRAGGGGGGLGVLALAVQNKALLLKHLHKFFNRDDVTWVDLTWKAFYTAALAP